jgi:putative restriction endonuclease
MKTLDIKKIFKNLTVWKKGGQRAPHKPLLALYALGRNQRGEGRLISYSEVNRDLKKLLMEFGPQRKSYHPEYPFWRFKKDGVWELFGADEVRIRKGSTDAPRNELLKHGVQGGFTGNIYKELSINSKLFAEVVGTLLETNFPASIHEDILQAVGIDLDVTLSAKAKRDPNFRERILTAYHFQCAVCGFNVRVGDMLVALEAAHIKWHQAGGPDKEENGVALCTMHHKLFDRGAFTINEDMKVEVSEKAHGTSGFDEWLLKFDGKLIRPPQRPNYYPEPKFVHWHIREVFKGPSRCFNNQSFADL